MNNAELIGDEELERALQDMKEEVRRRLPAVLRVAAMPIENDAKILCPYRTGNLRRSIHTEIEEEADKFIVAEIGTNVEYAKPVEFGTGRRKAKPYLRPAFDNNKTNAVNTAKDLINDLIRIFGD